MLLRVILGISLALFSWAGFLGYQMAEKRAQYLDAEGTVQRSVKLKTGSYSWVEMPEGTLRKVPDALEPGTVVTVYFSPALPQSAWLRHQLFPLRGVVILCLIALALGGLAGTLMWAFRREDQRRARLNSNYQVLQATLLNVEKEDEYEADSEASYRASAFWKHPHTGEAHAFILELMSHAEVELARRRGRVPVQVERGDLSNYQLHESGQVS